MEINLISGQVYATISIDCRLTDTNRYELTNCHRLVPIDRIYSFRMIDFHRLRMPDTTTHRVHPALAPQKQTPHITDRINKKKIS